MQKVLEISVLGKYKDILEISVLGEYKFFRNICFDKYKKTVFLQSAPEFSFLREYNNIYFLLKSLLQFLF